MKKLVILGVLLVVVLAGGALTSYMIANHAMLPIPLLTTTENPDASTVTMVGWKAEQLFILIGFLLVNLIGIAVTIAIVVWFMDRGTRRVRAEQAKAIAQAGADTSGAS